MKDFRDFGYSVNMRVYILNTNVDNILTSCRIYCTVSYLKISSFYSFNTLQRRHRTHTSLM